MIITAMEKSIVEVFTNQSPQADLKICSIMSNSLLSEFSLSLQTRRASQSYAIFNHTQVFF